MILTIAQVLDAQEIAEIHTALDALPFERAPSGWASASVKHNTQARPSLKVEAVSERIAGKITANAVFAMAARPKRLIGPLFSRYADGQSYGAHVDDPILDGARADIAFTLFLSALDSYAGGELVVSNPGGDEAFRLPAGHLVLYPATTLHRVTPVTRGTRYAAVGWVRSYMRSAEHRELLFELDTARRALFERHGKTAEFDLLTKTSANLVRLWADD